MRSVCLPRHPAAAYLFLVRLSCRSQKTLSDIKNPKGAPMKIRRVVTGHTHDGKAIVASDTEVDGITVALMPGMEFHRLWGADTAPIFPDRGSPYPSGAYFPPVGGFRFGLFTVPPDSV